MFDLNARRLALRSRILAATGIPNLYFQPPESKKLSYPCIVYGLSQIPAQHADNQPYRMAAKFTLTLIDRDAESVFVSCLANMKRTHFDRWFTADNLNHWVYTTYE